jgi:hypothetical protein
MSTRNNILDNMVDTLKTIRKNEVVQKFVIENGSRDYTYTATPKLVSKDFELWTGCQTFPAIFVNSGDAITEGQPTKQHRVAWDVSVMIYVKNDSGVEEKLSGLIEDVLIALYQDIERGGYATATFVTRIDTETRLQKGYGLAEIIFTIIYHFGL